MSLQVILFWSGVTLIVAYGLMHVLFVVLHYPVREWENHLWEFNNYPTDSLASSLAMELASRWRRWKSQPPQSFRSPSRRYRLKEFLAAGDLCDVHLAAWGSQRAVMKIPRNEKGESFLRSEFECLGQLRALGQGQSYQRYLPKPIERFRFQDRYLSVFEYEPGLLSARDMRSCFPDGLPDHHLAWMFNRTLEILGFVHEQGMVHGAILPTHLLFHPDTHGAQLIGWTHAVRTNERLVVVPGEYRHWYPPECVRREPVTPATDIYLAAKTMLWLSGGDVETNRFPRAMSVEMQNFLSGCLEPDKEHRPHDAWALHREFKSILEDLFGQPRFHDLWVA